MPSIDKHSSENVYKVFDSKLPEFKTKDNDLIVVNDVLVIKPFCSLFLKILFVDFNSIPFIALLSNGISI